MGAQLYLAAKREDAPPVIASGRGRFELLVGQLLTATGFEDGAVTRYSGDGGTDVDATLTVGGVTRVRTAIQVTRWTSNVSGATVREQPRDPGNEGIARFLIREAP
jgi:HJR/Mrr/RecB family endonuclease